MRGGWRLLAPGVAVLLACGSGDGGADRASGAVAVEEAAPLPEGRTGVAGALWQGKIVVAGGYTDDSRSSRRVDVFDAAAGTWARAADLPAAVDHPALVSLGDRLYVIGGFLKQAGDQGSPTASVYSLGPGDATWAEEAPLATPRAALAAVAVGGSLLALGGVGPTGVLATTELYDPASRTWTPGPTMRVPREHLAAAAVGSRVYAIGGQHGTVESAVASTESLVLPDGEWQPGPELTVTRRAAGAAAVNGRVCVAGGEPPLTDGTSVECLDGDAWTLVATTAELRHGLAVVAEAGRLHLLGGGSPSGLFVTAAHDVVRISKE